MSLSDLRFNAGWFPSERDRLLEKFADKNSSDDKIVTPEFFIAKMTCYQFESVIRPEDNALVIHLKHLAPALRNRKFFDYAAQFIRDRIGKFATMDASFIGEVDKVNKLNSLDLIFTQYYPARMHDMEFIKKHTAKIGYDLDQTIIRELGAAASANIP
jgi:hypothetical protein